MNILNLFKKKKPQDRKIQLSGQFLQNIWVNSPVNVYKDVNDVVSFLHQDKFPYLWPDLKDYIESINESDNPQEELKFQWLKIYLYHPDPLVRKAVVELNANNDSWSISQTLCDLLVDPDKDVRTAVYKATWQREKHNYCELILAKLRDEIQGTVLYSKLGKEKAVRALKKLVEYAPDASSKEKMFENIKRAGLYEYIEKPNAEKSKSKKKEIEKGVKFVKKIYKDKDIMGSVTRLTYEIYTAENKEQARKFLKTKSVKKDWYFIEVKVGDVNDPEVVIGLDTNGSYEI